MIIVFSAVLLNFIQLITPLAELSSCNDSSGECSDTETTVDYEPETTTERVIETTRYFDSREWFFYTPVIYPTPKPRAAAPLKEEGAFFNFTLDIYGAVLEKFLPSRIGDFFNVLGSELSAVTTTRRRSCESFLKYFMKRLGRKAKQLSRYGVSKIKEKIRGLMNDTLEAKPKRQAFFESFNSLFTLKYQLKLDAFVYYLRGYGKGREHKRVIKKQTKKMLRTIFYLIEKQEDKVRDDVILKLLYAYAEYYS